MLREREREPRGKKKSFFFFFPFGLFVTNRATTNEDRMEGVHGLDSIWSLFFFHEDKKKIFLLRPIMSEGETLTLRLLLVHISVEKVLAVRFLPQTRQDIHS